jgi:hypothetical protein
MPEPAILNGKNWPILLPDLLQVWHTSLGQFTDYSRLRLQRKQFCLTPKGNHQCGALAHPAQSFAGMMA